MLAAGYFEASATSPRRAQGYFSTSRSGVTSSGAFTTRKEEHLAVGLCRRGELALPSGERLQLLDYQTPLKSVRADEGIGKIDLLGLHADGTLAVVELKDEQNAEDRRIALLEGLIYGAVVEANITQIAKEFGDAHHQTIMTARPRVLVIARTAYWSDGRAYPSTNDLVTLADGVARAIPLDIKLLRLCDADWCELGLVAVEVKFGEGSFGRCSRPNLTPDKPNYERDHCDGSFAIQRGRRTRCSLSERGIRYWQFVPHLFAWSGEQDHYPCPLELTYQLARNVLAACVDEGGTLDTENGHALVIYDARNPAFHPGGEADVQWWAAVRALRFPRLLRRLSWQGLATHLSQFRDLDWLTAGLRDKYGIRCESPPIRGDRL